jgi:hypothetical protein
MALPPPPTPGKRTSSIPKLGGGTGNPLLDQLLAAGGGGNDENYIGVPGNYSVGGNSPQYRANDEFNILGNMSEGQRRRVQQQLLALGLADPTQITFGQVDPYTVQAFEAVLGYANMQGKSWNEMLFSAQGSAVLNQRRAQAGRGGGGGGGGRAPQTVQVSSPDTLRRLFRKAMVEMAGSRVEGFDIEAAVQAYQQVEAGYQKQAYGMAPTGGTIADPPSAEVFIADRLEGQAGTEVQSNSIAERAGSLLNMIQGGSI